MDVQRRYPASELRQCSVCSLAAKYSTNLAKQAGGALKDTKVPLYEKLTPNEEFRTITLQSGSWDDDVKCTLHRHCVRHPPQYEALSYEWGPPSASSSAANMISLNGVQFAVTENAWTALRHLRQRKANRSLWIDSICIWQSNSEERTEQVSKMGLIYSRATRVITWVGTTMEDVVQSSMVFLLELFARDYNQAAVKNAKREKPVPYARVVDLLSLHPPTLTLSENAMRKARHQRKEWQNMARFFSLRYWTRLWIVQEVVLARDLRVQCGNCFVEGVILCRFLKYLRSTTELDMSRYILDLGSTAAAKVLYYKIDMESQKLRPGPGLVETLVTFARSRCADPRDKIYALLGISTDAKDIRPDYDRTPLQLYELVIAMKRFRTDDQLVMFSQLLQRLLGGLLHPNNTLLATARAGQRSRQESGVFFTRAVIYGSISVIGDIFTTPEQARDLLVNWYSLYFHRIQNHEGSQELPGNVEKALSSIAKDAKRAVAVDSRLSYSYAGRESSTKPTWEEVVVRYRDHPVEHVTAKPDELRGEPASSRVEGGHQEGKGISVPKEPDGLPYVKEQSGDDCHRSGNSDVCECLHTTRIPIRPRWMIGSRGQVGLVPGTAEEGDIICHFQKTDVAVVVRRCPDGWFYSVVGGAIIIRQWDEGASRIHDRYPEVFKYSTGTHRRDSAPFDENVDQLSIHFDQTCLRLLTCPATDLGPFSEERAILAAPKKDHYEAFLSSLSGGQRESRSR